MGIYDRDYYRQERPSGTAVGPRSAVGILIAINVVVYVADWAFLEGREGRLTPWFHLTVGTLWPPWEWWQFVTYAFLHAREPQHIIFNMLGLFFLGRDIEEVYGTKEFLRVYLAMAVFGGVAWAAAGKLQGAPDAAGAVGASGAISGIVILYALNFPRRMLALFFVIPVPAWFAGVLLVVGDAYGAMARPGGSRVAYAVHLGGAALALTYYGLGWNFGRWWPRSFSFSLRWLRPRPKLRVHTPDDRADRGDRGDRADPAENDLSEEVDRILEKISREGEASLTREERRTLETASRQYQKRRQDPNDRIV
jgi:membrane associated rhomboid family serine protease